MVDKSQETTHFGFQTVAKEQKADMVAHVFHSMTSYFE
ncbi:bifunctional demethylmenaquinone methyltransferase/2-methoxy-6-polyprenyl-1,4-benzoquinol methylase UbiE, partial [Escherichia sp. TWPC-MK]